MVILFIRTRPRNVKVCSMPLVQFVNQARSIRITKQMDTPKKITRLDRWFSNARKAIPEIPPVDAGEWMIEYEEATLEWVRFDLRSTSGLKSNIVIFRKVNTL